MKVLVANRGEIACRILKTLREMGIPSVAIYSDADADAPHLHLADESVAMGDAGAYLDLARIIKVAQETGATALHPGYGFLSENAQLSQACRAAGITFIGPSPQATAILGDKRAAREAAERCSVPVIPGASACDTVDKAHREADRLGYPILIKAALGGGGKGVRRVNNAVELSDAFAAAQREALAAFRDGRLLVEKYMHPVRHIEVQILADGKDAIAVGERECSLQRRYQKLIEEAPAAAINDNTRTQLHAAAVRLAQAAGYSGAGTVEFLVDADGGFYFLEVNTRLQVEHPVTEMLTGLDLVRAQIEIAAGGALPAVPTPRGHAIEVRLNAEDAYAGFVPSTGKILLVSWPAWPHVRIDAGIYEGAEVSPHYDLLLAKIIAWAPEREQARRRLCGALRDTTVLGVTTNQPFLLHVLERDFFKRAATYTTTIESETWNAAEPPEAALALAEKELTRTEQIRVAGATGPSQGDAFSPWGTLGEFRVTP